MSSKLLLFIFIHGFPSTLFSIQNNIVFLQEQTAFNVLQTFITDWDNYSTKSSLVIQNSYSVEYPVFCQYQVRTCGKFHVARVPLVTYMWNQVLVNPEVGYMLLQRYIHSGSDKTSRRMNHYWQPPPMMDVKVHSKELGVNIGDIHNLINSLISSSVLYFIKV